MVTVTIRYFAPYTFANQVVTAPTKEDALLEHEVWCDKNRYCISSRHVKSVTVNKIKEET